MFNPAWLAVFVIQNINFLQASLTKRSKTLNGSQADIA
jgi:hypothetical protein